MGVLVGGSVAVGGMVVAVAVAVCVGVLVGKEGACFVNVGGKVGTAVGDAATPTTAVGTRVGKTAVGCTQPRTSGRCHKSRVNGTKTTAKKPMMRKRFIKGILNRQWLMIKLFGDCIVLWTSCKP
jgi:hypothetical protein